ncbi:hypothetical protein ACKVMH_12340 [Lysobacter zhanggongensis]|uniref:Uncharacterized protein n=1 Tax=Lysobacter zhanggongensis TaxID=1774951 RepID=A0ABU7YTB8_9GAMM
MLRLCICLVFIALSAGVAAREIKMSSPNSGACKDAAVVAKGDPAAVPARAEARETRIKPSIHSDTATRVSSPRWHSFLPGMFR